MSQGQTPAEPTIAKPSVDPRVSLKLDPAGTQRVIIAGLSVVFGKRLFRRVVSVHAFRDKKHDAYQSLKLELEPIDMAEVVRVLQNVQGVTPEDETDGNQHQEGKEAHAPDTGGAR